MRLTTTVYRMHHPAWSWVPESGRGAALHGGRFNPVGVEALYTSLRVTTALLEAQQGFAYKTLPLTLCAYDVDCDDMLDLRDPAVRRSYEITPDVLACPWKEIATCGAMPPSWAMATRLRTTGIAGIIVPSFAHGAGTADVNVVFWRWTTSPHRVMVIDPEKRLPKDQSSWR